MMSTPKPLHDTSADRSTKVMGLALRDVNESLAGSLGAQKRIWATRRF